MSQRVFEIPPGVRGKAEARGRAGRDWARELGGLVEDLEREWGLDVGVVLSGGTEALVAEAVTSAGQLAVLKIALPGCDTSGEIECLRRADGHGYARLLRADEARHVLLVERLGPSLDQLGFPPEAQIEAICATLLDTWSITPDPAFLSGAEKARSLALHIRSWWESLERPCSRRVIDEAVSYCSTRERAFDAGRAVFVHGDAHASNTLQAAQGFKFVDPDGLFAEPACDLVVPMREWSRELLDARDPRRAAQLRCTELGRLTGVESQAIWEWGFMERVSTGLLARSVGMEQAASDMLDAAEALAAR